MAYELWTVSNSGHGALYENVVSHKHPRGGLLRIDFEDGSQRVLERTRAYRSRSAAMKSRNAILGSGALGEDWLLLGGYYTWVKAMGAPHLIQRNGDKFEVIRRPRMTRADVVATLDTLAEAKELAESL